MRTSIVVRIVFLALALLGSQQAFADHCTDTAQQAYDRALWQCRNGGGNDYCRRNSDCGIGQACVQGFCTNATVSCIPRCSARYTNGQCYQYTQDFCGVDPQCTDYCSARYANGQCYQYGQDLCANDPIQCVPNCTARYPNGQCYQYGADICQ